MTFSALNALTILKTTLYCFCNGDQAGCDVKGCTLTKACGFMGPYLTRRVAQSAWELSAIACLSSATSHVLCGLSGRVSMDAHGDEQRREQAEARVSCSLPSFLWTSIRKNGRREAKRNATYIVLESNEIAIVSASTQ